MQKDEFFNYVTCLPSPKFCCLPCWKPIKIHDVDITMLNCNVNDMMTP